ncbi:hypothetical protein E2C01_061020 [Portunus trituberculatus]|uniref:Uncharacterized protein n=1 Tax=Portunus trituberculatus TaxID=210409 RepID=A0A5B7HB68_PORTR|nr:hypothetical protein [Portunus trituberculatus]
MNSSTIGWYSKKHSGKKEHELQYKQQQQQQSKGGGPFLSKAASSLSSVPPLIWHHQMLRYTNTFYLLMDRGDLEQGCFFIVEQKEI